MGNLLGKYVGVAWFCDDIHSGADADAAFGIPAGVPEGYYFVGQCGVSAHQGFEGYTQLVVANPPGEVVLKAPDYVEERWEKTGWGGMTVVSLRCSDENYVTIGDLYLREYSKQVKLSDWPLFRCVHKDWLRAAHFRPNALWSDHGSGAQKNVTLWSIDDSAFCVRAPTPQSNSSYQFRSVKTIDQPVPSWYPWTIDQHKVTLT
jgi:hypothetical protein